MSGYVVNVAILGWSVCVCVCVCVCVSTKIRVPKCTGVLSPRLHYKIRVVTVATCANNGIFRTQLKLSS